MTASPKAKILIVEDDVDLLDTYAELLEDAGYTAVKSKNGIEAMFKLKNGVYDLILTDVNMPTMSGDKMIETILAHEKGQQGKFNIIISSGFADGHLVNKFKNQPRVHFLPKPLDRDTLLNKIQSLTSAAG